jgi:hypothetical protein
LLEAAKDAPANERKQAVQGLAEALTAADPLTVEHYAKEVKSAGLTNKTVFEKAVKAARERLAEADLEEWQENTELPCIDAGDRQLRRATALTWHAIHAGNDPPSLFVFGGVVVRIEHDDTGAAITKVVNDARMRYRLARCANWYKMTDEGRKDALPPTYVVKDVLATPDPQLPRLKGIASAPVFAPDGTLRTKPGYLPDAQVFYDDVGGWKVPPVPAKPSYSDLGRAKQLILEELLVDFPFTGEPELAHAVALLLLPFVREMIDGPTPLHLVEKPTPGTGAGLLLDVVLYPALGRPAPIMTEGSYSAEWRKRLTAKLLDAPRAIVIDNLRAELDAGELAAAITAPVWEDRILGHSISARIPVRCAWVATGNNPSLSLEIARRSVRIRMDAKMDRPWLRDKFKHPNLREWVQLNRAELVWAALTIVQHWVSIGSPPGQRVLGNFESWAQVLGGILNVADIPGFLDNIEDLYERADTESPIWREFVAKWWHKFGEKEVTVAHLYPFFNGVPGGIELLGYSDSHASKTRLGMELRKQADRTYTVTSDEETLRLTIKLHGQRQGANTWRLECDP